MALRCPDCGQTRLHVMDALELGSFERSDEIALQIVECADCGLEVVAVYEEARRGALDDESVSHAAYPTDAEALEEIRGLIASCRDRREPDCPCRGHARAREMVRDRIEPLGVDWSSPMPIVFVRT